MTSPNQAAPEAVRTTAKAWDGSPLPAVYCPACSKKIRLRADGVSMFTHNASKGRQCKLSRKPVTPRTGAELAAETLRALS